MRLRRASQGQATAQTHSTITRPPAGDAIARRSIIRIELLIIYPFGFGDQTSRLDDRRRRPTPPARWSRPATVVGPVCVEAGAGAAVAGLRATLWRAGVRPGRYASSRWTRREEHRQDSPRTTPRLRLIQDHQVPDAPFAYLGRGHPGGPNVPATGGPLGPGRRATRCSHRRTNWPRRADRPGGCRPRSCSASTPGRSPRGRRAHQARVLACSGEAASLADRCAGARSGRDARLRVSDQGGCG